ncbi:hypothetical protein HAX54_008901, partial [Datura stramonium]|nr:hypothetical protein [Datura stramonium]
RLMGQIPIMSQQWEDRDEGERHGIYFEHTMQIETNVDAPTLVFDPSEAGLIVSDHLSQRVPFIADSR